MDLDFQLFSGWIYGLGTFKRKSFKEFFKAKHSVALDRRDFGMKNQMQQRSQDGKG